MDKLPGWLAGYQLPEPGHPLHQIEAANLDLLKSFYALLALTSSEAELNSALHKHLPELPVVPLAGPPSGALAILGLGRRSGPVLELRAQLRRQLTPEQARDYLLTVDG